MPMDQPVSSTLIAKTKVSVAWEALEDAFENNAHEVHSYLHVGTGEVTRLVDGVADPAMHARVAADVTYRRIDPVSSREQYRWMERFIETVEDDDLRSRLNTSIDGKGAFRRFKDALMSSPVERERWFVFRSERLRVCIESWLQTQGLEAVKRAKWEVPVGSEDDAGAGLGPRDGVVYERSENPDISRRRYLGDLANRLPSQEVHAAIAYLEFLSQRARKEAHGQTLRQDTASPAQHNESGATPMSVDIKTT